MLAGIFSPNFGLEGGGLALPGHWLKVAQQFGEGNSKADGQHFEDAQTCFPAPVLKLGDVDPPNS